MQSAMRVEALDCVKKIRERSFRGRSVIAVIGVQPATPGGHLAWPVTASPNNRNRTFFI